LQYQRTRAAVHQHLLPTLLQLLHTHTRGIRRLLADLHVRQLHMPQQRRRTVPVHHHTRRLLQPHQPPHILRDHSHMQDHRCTIVARNTRSRCITVRQHHVIFTARRLAPGTQLHLHIRQHTDRSSPPGQTRRYPHPQRPSRRQGQPAHIV
ncbi:MAG: hypothetical protein ACK559_31305, partial [bacterium]